MAGSTRPRPASAPADDARLPRSTFFPLLSSKGTRFVTPFNGTTGHPSVRMPIFGRNMVSPSHALALALAAQAGIRMLWQGGNAV